MKSIVNVPILKTSSGYTLTEQEQSFVLDEVTYNYVSANNNFLSSDYKILESGRLDGVRSVIEQTIEQYRVHVCGIKQQFVITQSWIARTLVGGTHGLHNHPNSIFSGVYYISCPDNSPLNFYHGNQLFKEFNFDLDYTHDTPYNTRVTNLDVKAGDIVIFPSWVNHDVDVNVGSEERVVLAFNTFITGDLGTNNFYPTGLSIK